VPAIAGTAYGAASLRNLLDYRSGAQDPGGDGYSGVHNGPDFGAMIQQRLTLVDLIKKYGGPGPYKAGEKFIYNGLDSETLSVVLRNATGQPLPRWFQDTVWQKAGGEHPAGWVTDREGNGVAEVHGYFTTRDYARLGLYTLERLAGRSGDACMDAFVKEAAATKIPKGYWDSAPFWGLGMHTGSDGNLWFMGHSGQRIGINLQKNRVVATTGYRDSRARDNLAQELLRK
jgi:CubicO group peptidase (beta-lactamase class C family)